MNFIKRGWDQFKKVIYKIESKDGKTFHNYNFGIISMIVLPFPIVFSICHYLIKMDPPYYSVACSLISIGLGFITLLYILSKIAHKQEKKDEEEIYNKQKTKTFILEKGYGNSIRDLYLCFSEINYFFFTKKENFDLKTTEEQISNIKALLEMCCNTLSKIYTEKTGSVCSVSIKIIENPEKNYESKLYNIERSDNARQRDENENSRKFEHHTVVNNTCFLEIYDNYFRKEDDSLFYTNPNLATDTNYKTTSVEAKIANYSKKDKKNIIRKLKNSKEREHVWRNTLEMEYDSEIVVPLLLAKNPTRFVLLGFLCVDSKKSDVFDEDVDVPLLKGVADGIYELLTIFLIIK